MTTHLVKLACELPDNGARSLSVWTCGELGRTLVRDGIVESISGMVCVNPVLDVG